MKHRSASCRTLALGSVLGSIGRTSCAMLMLGLYGCDSGHQAYSLATIRGYQQRIERERARTGRLPDVAEFHRLVPDRVLRDGWNRDVLYMKWSDAGRERYVLVALGRDGKAECDSGACYCAMDVRDVSGVPDADQVICDGQALRYAGK